MYVYLYNLWKNQDFSECPLNLGILGARTKINAKFYAYLPSFICQCFMPIVELYDVSRNFACAQK